MHSAHAGRLYCTERLDRRQQYKRQLLTERYNAKVSDELADRLLYVDRQPDQVVIALRDYAGAIAGRVIDKGDRLTAGRRGTAMEIQTLIDLSIAKGWKQIHITGTESFKARAWTEATRAGLAVVGYEPSPDLRAQLHQEKSMLGQAGAGMMALTPDVTAGQTSPASRWLDPLRAAREKLEAERRTAKDKLAGLRETDLKALERGLAVAQGGQEYRDARRKFKAAALAAKDAGLLTRKRAEAEKEKAWQVVLATYAKAIAVPAAVARLAEAAQQNQEHARLTASLLPLQLGIGEIEALEGEIQRGRDPEAEFLQAWQRRKMHPLKPWQELVLVPVFEAHDARERARLQAEADAAELDRQAQRQEQIQHEIAAQQQADAIEDQLGQPGLTVQQEEALEQQQRYYQALADGNDEAEARERAAKKSDAPRPR